MTTKQTTKTIIAIDPGETGGIVIMRGSEISAHPLKKTDPRELLRKVVTHALANRYSMIAYIEKVGGYIGKEQPGSRMFTFGASYGRLIGLCEGNDIPLKQVIPQVWQKGIPGVVGEKRDRKNALREHASRLFPSVKVTVDTGDALCIAHYAAAIEAGQPGAVWSNEPIVAKPKRIGAEKCAKKKSRATFDENPIAAELDALSATQRMALAVAWCESQGWPVPAPRTPERASMYDYWLNKAINGEIPL